MKRKLRKILVIITIIIIIVSTGGCGASSKKSSASKSETSMDVSKGNSGLNQNNSNNTSTAVKGPAIPGNSSKDNVGTSIVGQGKIIRNGIIQMQTLSFDNAVKQILSKASNMGAYVQSSNVSGVSIETKLPKQNRSATFTLRIPKTKLDSFLLDIGNLGSITNQQLSTEDVTAAYFDTQAHLKSLTIQEERLLEMLKKTGELKDIIVLEKELSSVRYEIEGLTGNLKKWDNLIDFSTLNIELNEVQKIKENPLSFIDKISNGFINSVKTLVDFGKTTVVIFFICIPYLIILSILLIIIRYILISRKKS